jgi:hypothetical protein
MIITQITGGLGNQLFQYAAAKALSLFHSTPLLLEISSFSREELPELEVPREFELFNFKGITEKTISDSSITQKLNAATRKGLLNKITPAFRREVYLEPHFRFDKNFFKAGSEIILKGGWQSEKYFINHETEIRKSLVLKEDLVKNVKSKANDLRLENSVAIHIRRGDYLRKKIIYEWHGVMNKEYFENAVEVIRKQIADITIYYFTDDPDWVRKELQPDLKGEIISGNISLNHYEDFYLMSNCSHNVIANSSFSWWAAWLNDNKEKIVIAPKKWFGNGPRDTQDILPSSWISI